MYMSKKERIGMALINPRPDIYGENNSFPNSETWKSLFSCFSNLPGKEMKNDYTTSHQRCSYFVLNLDSKSKFLTIKKENKNSHHSFFLSGNCTSSSVSTSRQGRGMLSPVPAPSWLDTPHSSLGRPPKAQGHPGSGWREGGSVR